MLAHLAELESKYGSEFSRAELAAFHQLRGAARLGAKNYRGALDDFRVAQKLGVARDSAEGVAEVIVKLEAYVAAEDAAAAISPPEAPTTDGAVDPSLSADGEEQPR